MLSSALGAARFAGSVEVDCGRSGIEVLEDAGIILIRFPSEGCVSGCGDDALFTLI